MTERNVGPKDALVRYTVGALCVITASVLMAAYPLGEGILLSLPLLVAAVLLWKSAVVRECPVHERLDVDTTE